MEYQEDQQLIEEIKFWRMLENQTRQNGTKFELHDYDIDTGLQAVVGRMAHISTGPNKGYYEIVDTEFGELQLLSRTKGELRLGVGTMYVDSSDPYGVRLVLRCHCGTLVTARLPKPVAVLGVSS